MKSYLTVGKIRERTGTGGTGVVEMGVGNTVTSQRVVVDLYVLVCTSVKLSQRTAVDIKHSYDSECFHFFVPYGKRNGIKINLKEFLLVRLKKLFLKYTLLSKKY